MPEPPPQPPSPDLPLPEDQAPLEINPLPPTPGAADSAGATGGGTPRPLPPGAHMPGERRPPVMGSRATPPQFPPAMPPSRAPMVWPKERAGDVFASSTGVGFVLFIACMVVAFKLQSLMPAAWAFGTVLAVAAIGVLIMTVRFRRSGMLAGWLVGFMIAAAVMGCWFSTCAHGWE